MATSKGYCAFILDQFSGTPGIACRAMMGEYVLYINGKVFGGIYDDRLLVKPLPAAAALLPDARLEAPYPHGTPMLLVDRVDDREFLQTLAEAMDAALPPPKPKKCKAP